METKEPEKEPEPPDREEKLKPYETGTHQIRPVHKSTVGGRMIKEIQKHYSKQDIN